MKPFVLRPTRLGFYLIGLNLILFLLATSYSNNLLLLFSLILISQTLFWYVETVRFSHPKIQNLRISSNFLGEKTICSFNGDNFKYGEIELFIDGKRHKFKNVSVFESTHLVSLAINHRGKLHLDKVCFYDSRPFSLFAKTIEIKPKLSFYIYPKLIPNIGLNLIGQTAVESGSNQSHQKGEEDFLGLHPYQGEDFKKIDWKYFARSDEIYIKQGLQPQLAYLDFIVPLSPSEEELSLIASQMVLALRYHYNFSFRIGDYFITHDSSQGHLEKCLERLSEC